MSFLLVVNVHFVNVLLKKISPTTVHVFVLLHSFLDETPFLMVVRDTVIFGIPLDPTDPSNNAMTPVSGISQGRDIDFDDQEQFVYWVQSTVSGGLKLKRRKEFYNMQ